MKFKYYSFLASAVLMLAAACTPDDHDLSAPELTADDLVEGKAYKVEIDQATNKVTMTSLLGNKYVTSWIHPQGIEKKNSTEARIPFAGDYEVKFGVMTRGGMVYGAPYKFSINTTNGDLLTDPLWTYLTGGADQSKTWVMDHGQLDLGSFTFICAPMGWDKFTDGKEYTEADYPTYKEDGVDSPNWSWGAGEPDWLFGGNSEIYAAMPELTFDLINGANLTVNGVTKPFVMDPDRKTLTMPAGVKWLAPDVADNWLVDWVNLELVKLNEHVLGIKAIRNDGKGGNGDQRMVICYVEKGWDGTWPSGGPSAELAPVQQPSYDNLAESLFTIVGSDASYLGTATTLLLNDETPYDYMWWNGAVKQDGAPVGAWQWIGNYGTPSAPDYPAIDDFALTLERNNGTYKASLETIDGASASAFTIEGNKLVFEKEITLLSVDNISISGKEFTVMACDPDNEEIVLGVPAAKDETGAVNRYLCARLKIKPIGGGQTGPTVLAVDNNYVKSYLESGDHYRIELYNAFYDEDGLYPIDLTKLRFKKGQTIKIRFTLSGIDWKADSDPKVLLAHNFDKDLDPFTWPSGGAGFDVPSAVSLNKNGETEISLTNTSDKTLKFERTSCLTICIQQKGLVNSPVDADGNIDASQVTASVTSLTIE